MPRNLHATIVTIEMSTRFWVKRFGSIENKLLLFPIEIGTVCSVKLIGMKFNYLGTLKCYTLNVDIVLALYKITLDRNSKSVVQ